MPTTSELFPRQRCIDLPAFAFADLIEGYLHLITNFDEGWSVGLIRTPDAALAHDNALAESMALQGLPLLRLSTGPMVGLSNGRYTSDVDDQGARYVIVVQDVEQLDELLEERAHADE